MKNIARVTLISAACALLVSFSGMSVAVGNEDEEVFAPAKLVAKNELPKMKTKGSNVSAVKPVLGIEERLAAERALAAQELESGAIPKDDLSAEVSKKLNEDYRMANSGASTLPTSDSTSSAEQIDTAAIAAGVPLKVDIKQEARSEKETPVQLLDSSKGKSDLFSWGRTIITLLVFVALFGGSAWAMKKYSKKVGKKDSKAKIQVLTQHYLGPKKSLLIIQVAGESLLIGVTDHNISMLKSIALIDDEVPQELPERFQVSMDDFAEEEEFQMENIPEIRDRVTRSRRVPRNMN